MRAQTRISAMPKPSTTATMDGAACRRDNSSKGLIQPGGKILLQILCRCRTRIRTAQFVVDFSKSGEAIGEPPQTGVARTGTHRLPRPRGSAPLMSWQGAERCSSGCDFTLRDAFALPGRSSERPNLFRVFGRLHARAVMTCTEAGVRKASREETARGVCAGGGVSLWGI